MATSDTVTPAPGYDITKTARWAKAAIAHAEVEAISDPPGYFANVPACPGALGLAGLPLRRPSGSWKRLWVIGAAVHLRSGNQPPLPAMGDTSLG